MIIDSMENTMRKQIILAAICVLSAPVAFAQSTNDNLPPRNASAPAASSKVTSARPVSQQMILAPQAVPPAVGTFCPVQECCDDGPTEHELLALDIARRSVLAHYPKAGKNPIRTLQVRVRPDGDVVHTYARVAWTDAAIGSGKSYESEVFASIVYTPDLRRLYDISYKDNRLKPWRMFNRRIDLLSKINEDLERRDPLRMATPLIGNRQDLLVPRKQEWIRHPLGGDHAWHASSADDYIDPRWQHLEMPVPVRQ